MSALVIPRDTEVLVIGGGLAALRAAAAARIAGRRVLLVARGEAANSGCSARASGGFAAALRAPDSPGQHFADTLVGGRDINDRAQLERLTAEAPRRLVELAAEVPGFHEDVAGLLGQPAPAHTEPRSVQFERGMPVLLAALRRGLESEGVTCVDRKRCVELTRGDDGRVCGAWFRDGTTGQLQYVAAGAVVLATGGCGQLFTVTSNGPDLTGDTAALALAAGCKLRDMEFIQFTPTAFAAPEVIRGRTIVGTLLTLPGVTLTNAEGERFLARHDPVRMERADRATLARAIAQEVQAGRGSPAGGVYLDLRSVSREVLDAHRPGFHAFCQRAGVDPARMLVETAPSAHTCLGGIQVDDDLRALPGLHAAGEAIGGVHGANRLSSNSLADALVTGWWAGRKAAADVVARPAMTASRPLLPSTGAGDVDNLVHRLRTIVSNAAGVLRDGQALADGLADLERIGIACRELGVSGVDDIDRWIDLRNLLETARLVMTAASLRKESRGAHFRADFPRQDDDNWRGYIALFREDGKLTHQYHPVDGVG